MRFLIALFALVTLALPATDIQGQRNITSQIITWTTGANTGKAKLLILSPDGSTYRTYLDTGTGAWKRIDNISDSCSQAFNLGGDSAGGARPIWLQKIRYRERSVDKDGGTFRIKIQTRERRWDATQKQWVWGDWSRAGIGVGTSTNPIADTINTTTPGTTAQMSAECRFDADGVQARACIAGRTGTATGSTDSNFIDSLFYYGR